MDKKLENILSEDEQQKLAEKGIELLKDDELELVFGGANEYSSGISVSWYHSTIRSGSDIRKDV